MANRLPFLIKNITMELTEAQKGKIRANKGMQAKNLAILIRADTEAIAAYQKTLTKKVIEKPVCPIQGGYFDR